VKAAPRHQVAAFMLFGVNSQTKNFRDLQASFGTYTYMTDSLFLFQV
jgi:hypothetical protein